MAKQTINVGVTDNDGTGSTIRAGGQIINSNFTEVYATLGDGSTITFDLSGATNGQALVYNSSTGKFEPGIASVSSDFIISGDGGADQTISTGDTLNVQGGTGITTTGVATDTLTIAVDATVATASSSTTFTNKTIDANGTGNSITNLEVADLASGVLDTDLSSVSASDDTLASAKAIKSYVDTEIGGISTVLTVRDDSSTTDNVTIGTDTLSFAGGTGLTSTVTDNTVTFDIDSTVTTLTGSQTLENKTISGSNNTLSNIANASLTNSTISIGGITFNLGDTDATPAIDLSDATNYPTSSLTGTITNAQLAGSIENAKLSNSTVSIVADDSSAQSISLGGSILFTGGSGVTTSISGNEITFATDGSIVTETSSDVLTNKTINGPDNTLTNIANGSLANSTITLGSDTINLGDTTTTITGLSLDGTGTIDLTGSGSKARFNFAGFGSLPTAATYEGMFAYDTTGQRPYVADAGGWVRILDENSNVDAHSDVNKTGVADGYILQRSSAQARFNTVPLPSSPISVSDDSSTSASLSSLGIVGGSGISTALDPGNSTVTITNTGPTAGFAIAMSIAL